ncbi:GMC oxidoreductase [Rhodonellum sp.]|uniref:GMC oxidoreductase n=1 Tax=Rhodonellum sp. TaxID=2231180 RepID=UPI0027187AF1|nr:GMC family oxidoreductase [Rhodonellum sp.]MDO9554275.1 GMC family oxidoreductase [Rhodonellum sp.]
MANLAIDAQKEMTFDAIVIGSGISGGWAAKELCEKGLKTLVLERGRDVKHIEDYPTATKNPWDFQFGGKIPLEQQQEFGARGARIQESTAHFWMKEKEQETVLEKPFQWTRGYQVGGKSLLWARQTQRWSNYDFEGPARDGYAVDWPIRYKDLAPWYSHVEKFSGISGNRDGLPQLPDGEFLKPFDLSCVERHFQKTLSANYKDRHLIHGRCAHITAPEEIHREQGRAKCLNRNLCNRGCPLGGYFSSNASTLPWAEKTGNMTLRPNSVVHSIIYDEGQGKATGVRVIDSETQQTSEYFAKIIFINASALNSNLILLNSTSSRFPNGLGNDNGLLGKYISWHNYRGHISGRSEEFQDMMSTGKNPSHSYIPRFRNVFKQETDFLRGYAVGFGSSSRAVQFSRGGIGEALKANLFDRTLGPWWVSGWMQGEVIPIETNHVRLHESLKDKYGIPQLVLSCDWTENDDKMVLDYMAQMTEMFEKAGFTDISARDSHSAPGSDIHEMGGVRMGLDPETSLLNKWNQLHSCKNVFVTDGACMTSTATQNPSLTYMAFTARAANFAVEELKKGTFD